MNCEDSRAARARRERGSALLIVFVFAAMIAIMLYAEMPVAVFEAKRQKEQLLINRGNEYAHAVKLFVRKFGMYPATVDQLEDTNRMRFLRHRYKDPFTGKEDWRMLHAGPGGMLTDSLVKPQGLGNVPGSGSNSSSSSSFASTSSGSSFGSGSASTGFGSSSTSASSGFGQSGFGSTSQSANANSADAVVVPEVPQRPPAISSNGVPSSGSGETAGAPAEGDQNPSTPLLAENLRDQIVAVEQGQSGAATDNSGQAAGSGQATAGASQTAQNNAPGQTAAPGATAGQNPMDTVRNMLNNPALGPALQGSGTTGATSTTGQISGGGIAGVASKAHGHTIKTVNDQTDYSLWEFYYDPTKDATQALPGIGNAAGGAQPNGTQPGGSTNGAGTGSIGQSTFGSSSFGQNPSNTSPATPTTAPTNPQQ